ncbi:uncharacterized protein LOC118184882, partial [Stegodyphus dumicola]|uniref:uncharacterized protein LOC118184882 n=1 Tax=Stegodyphus dumicola TaxID=202533 RepID=UPI0015ABF47A
ILQSEIEGKGKYISSLLKLCECLEGDVRFGQNSVWDAERVQKVANNLEHKWHSIWLRSLECHCILEELMRAYKTGCDKLEKSFSDEPVKKYPRLSDYEEISLLENELKNKMSYKFSDSPEKDPDNEDLNFLLTDSPLQKDECSTVKNDKAIMVGDTGITELKAECGTGKFEIVQDIGYSSETSAHFSNDEKLDVMTHIQNVENHQRSAIRGGAGQSVHNLSPNSFSCTAIYPNFNKIHLAPDKYPSVSLKTLHILTEDKPLYQSKYNRCKSVPDTFYKVTAIDDDAEPAVNFDLISKNQNDSVDSLNDNKLDLLESNSVNMPSKLKESVDNTKVKNTGSQLDNLPHISHKKGKRVSSSTINSMPLKTLNPDELWKKCARVCEWLNTCESVQDCSLEENLEDRLGKGEWSHKTIDSSCDASGEYTTESDSEKSNTSDVNNSASFSQSFTGSIETVIPAVPEDSGIMQSDRAGSTEPSPVVRMRKKKRVSRDRPWSVSGVHQTVLTPASVPHSTSEGALNLLCSSQDGKKIHSKTAKTEKKRLSLTDVSALNCCSAKSSKSSQRNSKLSNSVLPGSDKPLSGKDSHSEQNLGNCDSLPSSVRESVEPKPVDAEEQISLIEKIRSLETTLSLKSKNDNEAKIEDQGSISDQAWDEYQDPPYLSEPYSEQTADEDEVRKLISFGDDYRAILGSYSDGSSISVKIPSHKSRGRSRSLQKTSSQSSRTSVPDSNSDSEDFHNILKTSSRALQFVSSSIKDSSANMSSLSSEFAELVATCQTNLCHLNAIHNELINSSYEMESLSKEDVLKLTGLIKEWEEVQRKVLNLSRNDRDSKLSSADLESAILDVHCSLTALKEKLSAMAVNATDAVGSAISLEQLKTNIQNLQAGLSNLQEMKESVLSISARILRLIAEGGGHAVTPLRDNATKLYRQWEDVYELNCLQLTKLQDLQSRWHLTIESEMDEDLETATQWQPVQVGDSLPKPEVSTEALHENTAAEIQVAEQLDVLMGIESKSLKATIRCSVFDDENKEFEEPVLHLSPPVLKLESGLNFKTDETTENSYPEACVRDRSRFWRSLRAAVPIQFALVVLYCMSCLMEPRCCENVNNFDFSILPQLRYLQGPPPV